jgi:filamentous hemagglutinin family protein
MQRKLVALAIAACFPYPSAFANPSGAVVAGGQATFARQGNVLSVTNTPGAIINWQQFSIGTNETTRFIQQSASSSVLNRVTGGDPSQILGTLQSNGRVFLINPNGILFGAGARVDVAGLVASTLRLSNEDFAAGRMNFTGDPAKAAAVVNQGRISAGAGGSVVLVGSAVDNQGVITAPNGQIVLAAGSSVRVAEAGTPQLQVEITAPASGPLNLSAVAYGSHGIYTGLVRNSGTLNADAAVRTADGRIVLKASNGVELAAGSTVTANGGAGGRIVVDAQQGSALVAGTISARGSDGAGGSVVVTGDSVRLAGTAVVDVSGATGGGTALIGGDLHGATIVDGDAALGNARATVVAAGAQIRADALDAGDGGKVVVWSDETTAFHGAISARGGAGGGNGGFVETSGKGTLDFQGLVDTRAPHGASGTLLLDPTNIYIALNQASATTAGMLGTDASANTGPSPFAATGAVQDSLLTTGTLTTALGLSNVIVTTTNAAGIGAGNITVVDAVAWATGNTLTLTAANNIAINAPITTGTAASALILNAAGSVTQTAAIGGAGGLTQTGAGTVTLNQANTYTGTTTVSAGTLALGASNTLAGAGALLVNGGTFDLGASDQTLAGVQLVSGSITGTTGTLSSAANFALQSGTVSAILGGAGGVTKTGAGTVTLSGSNTYTGTTTVSAGTLALGASNALASAGALLVNGGTFDLGASNQTLAGVQLVSGSITGTIGTLSSGANFALQSGTVSAILGGAGGVTKTGAGTVTLSGNNTYAGATTVSAGTLAATANNALGATGAGTTVAAGATLDLQNVSYASLEPVTLNGGTLAASTGTSTFAGPVTLGANSIASVTGTQLTLSGAIGDGGSGFGLNNTGAGILVLSGANTYTGTTTVSAGTVTLGASNTLAGAGALLVNGGTFDLGASDQTLAGVQLVSGAITGTTGTLSSAANFDLQAGTVSAILGGAGGVAKTGAGTVTLSGNNTYAGATTVSAGTLAATANNALGATGAGTAVAAGATLDLQNVSYGSAEAVTLIGGTLATSVGTSSFAGPVTLGTTGLVAVDGTQLTLSGAIGDGGSGFGLTKTGTGTLVLAAAETYTGATTVSAGTLTLGASNLLVSSTSLLVNGGSFNLGANNQTLAGVQLASGSIAGAGGVLTSTTNYDLRSGTVSAILAGAVGVNKTTGGAVSLSGNNTYTGATTVSAGSLGAAANNALGTTGAGTTVAAGALLDFQNVNYASLEPVTLNGGAIGTSVGTSVFAGPVTLGASSFGTASGTQLTLTGVIGDGGSGFGFTKNGAGTLVLANTETYTGNTTVSGGTLTLGGSNLLVNATSLIVNGGTFNLGANNQTFAGVQLASGAITGTSGVLTSNSNYDMRSGTASAILAGAVGLNKTTGGTVVLSGNNTYTGATTVSAGTLGVAANNALGTVGAGTTVAAGATLDFQNVNYSSLEPVTLNGGTIATSVGTSTFAGPITLGANSFASVTGTQLTLSGSINDGGNGYGLTKNGPLVLVLSGGSSYTGITNVNAGTVALGSNNALDTGSSLVVNGGTFDVNSYNQTLAGVQLASGSITGTSGVLTSTSNFDFRSGFVSAILAGTVGVDKNTGGTVTLAANNIFTGATNVSAGTLAVTVDHALGTTGANTTVASGATLDFQNVNYSSLEPVTVNGGTLATSLGTSIFAGPVTLGADSIVSVTGTQLTLSGAIGDGGGGLGFNKTGPGTLVLSAVETYTGTATVSAGTLALGAGNILDNASRVAVTGGTFDVGTFSDTVAGVQLASGAITGTTGVLTSLSDFDLQSGTASAILAGAVGATKTTAGNVTLSGSNTYTGLTAVNAGTLTVTNGNALGATGTGTTVAGGATLAINNAAIVAEPVTLNGNGFGGIGALTGTGTASLAGNVTLASASTIGVATAADTLALSGTIEGPGALNLIGSGAVTLGNTVGAATALASLNQSATTSLNLNGGLVRTTGDQVYAGPVTTGGATTLRTTANGNITSTGRFTATAGTLTLDTGAGDATFSNLLDDFGTVQVTSGGDVSLVDANSVTIGNANLGTLSARALAGNLTLGGNVTATGAGDSIVLAASGNFINTAGAAALDPGPGRFLVYSTNPAADVRGGLAYNFKQYNATYGGPVLGAGNGFLYTVAPSVAPSLTGSVAKVYDGTTAATLTPANYSFAGVLDGDTITLGNAASGVYASPNVGSGINVSVAGLTLAGASNGGATVYGYTLASTSANANVGDITPRALSVTANNQAKPYGTTFTPGGTEFTSSGLQNGETIGSVTLTSAVGGPPTASVAGGPYAIVPSAAAGGTFSASNYTISYVNGALTVTPVALTVTANDQVKAYGGSPFLFTGTEFTSSGLKNGDTIASVNLSSPAQLPAAPVGTYPISVSGATGPGFAASNYTITYVPGNFTVNPAGVTLVITANNITKTYGTAITFNGTEFTSTGLQNGETIGSVTLASAGAAATAPVAASPYVIFVTAATGGTFNPGNYTINYVNGALTVNPAPLTIRADDKTRLPNTPNPVFTATYSGLQNGETPSALAGTLVFNTTATASSPPGSYAIVPSGQTSTNYAITFVNGTLLVRAVLDSLTNPLYAALSRFYDPDPGDDFLACQGQGGGGASAPLSVPRAVASQPKRQCQGSQSGVSGDVPPPRIGSGEAR